MPGRECYHCKQWVEQGEAHDCHTTTEAALTRDLSEDLRDAWERLRETAADFGGQRIYASGKAIMFARERCYFFVRPRVQSLEVCIFLGRALKSPLVRKTLPASKTKTANLLRITHRDQVEPPITDWMREAYEVSEALSARTKVTKAAKVTKTTRKTAPETTAKKTRRTTRKTTGKTKTRRVRTS